MLVLVTITITVYSQDLRLRAFSSTYSYANKKGEFKDLTINEHKSNILVVIGSNTITIYAKKISTYSILVIDNLQSDDIGPYSTTSLLDDESIRCEGKMYLPIETDTYHLIIEYKNLMLIYNCREEK